MRKYKAPGAYAHFIPTENVVGTTGQMRVLALVGTGQQSFETKNALITRTAGSISDQLPNQNILEVHSVSTKPIVAKPDPSNKMYNNFTLKDDRIVWNQLVGPQYDAKIDVSMAKGDNSFLSNITATIVDKDFVVDEEYKVEISYADKNDIGTYMVTKMSTGEIIGEYVASFAIQKDIIPGVNLKITSTFILDLASPEEKSKTKIGDYVIIKTSTAKCHVDPTFNIVKNSESLNSAFNIVNGGSNYNIVGDGRAYISDVSLWPKIKNQFKISKALTTLKYQISFYKNGLLTNADELFTNFSVGVNGNVAGVSKNSVAAVFETAGPKSVVANTYDITSLLGLSTSVSTDNFGLSYLYVLKEDMALDDANITIHLDVINTATVVGNNKIASVDNGVFVRNGVIPHSTMSQDEILYSLIKNVKINDSKRITAGTYKIKISDLETNEITIFDITNNKTVGVWSTNVNVEFKEAIPGLSFELYSFKDVEGISEMYGSKDITDLTGATIVITTLSGITNPEVPMDNSNYYISYKYAKSEIDYDPKIFTEYTDVIAEYGKYIVTASGKVINNLTLAAELAFLNGASPIVCVQAKNESDQEMNLAIDKLAKKVGVIDNINAVVPITNSLNVGNYLVKHVDLLSSDERNMYRIGYLSALSDEVISKEPTVSSQSRGSIQMAQYYNNERIVYVVPGKAVKSITDSITGFTSKKVLPGCYLATAVAALSMRNDPAEPLTNKQILGFDDLLMFYGEPESNVLATSGCLVLKQEGTTIRVRHGITTHGSIETLADIQSNEITLVQIKDYVIDGARKTLGDLYVGGKLKPTIVHDIEYTLTNLLNKYIADNIIIGIEGLVVKRDLNDPRQINVKFLIEAVYPLNYIDISFGFSTTIS